MTAYRDRVRLFLDHSIQFDSIDEYRYHEMLVHPAMAMVPRARNVLILGGGDGMATREVLRHEGVEAVTLVDLDPAVTTLFRDHPDLSRLNARAFSDPRVTVVNQDAWEFVEASDGLYDVIILDLPDPKNLALSRLYSRSFYGLLAERLSAHGAMVTQAGSPLFAREAFWSIAETFETATNPLSPGRPGLWTLPYHSFVPSFGEWGFMLAAPRELGAENLPLPEGLRYLNADEWQAARLFAGDIARVEVEANTLQTHALVGYYLDGWDRWFP